MKMANYAPLSKRAGRRPATHKGMPHAQIGVRPDPQVNAELFRRAFSLPGVEDRPSVISVPGARALWLGETLPLARPDVIVAERTLTRSEDAGQQ